MAKKSFSSSLFWAKHLALALVVVIVAGVVIQLQLSNSSSSVPVDGPKEKSVSQGLSDFYREFRMTSTDPKDEEKSEFALDLPNSDLSVDEQLSAISGNLKPVSTKWEGEQKYRTFKAGNTLREAITSYAQQEGMRVIWGLDQDFVIKHQFQMDDTILGSLSQIASAIDSNFEGEVKAYICPDQRSLVVTSEHTDYLKNSCRVAR